MADLKLFVQGKRVTVETHRNTVGPLNNGTFRLEFPFKLEGVAEAMSITDPESFEKSRERGEGMFEIRIRRLEPREEEKMREKIGMVPKEDKSNG